MYIKGQKLAAHPNYVHASSCISQLGTSHHLHTRNETCLIITPPLGTGTVMKRGLPPVFLVHFQLTHRKFMDFPEWNLRRIVPPWAMNHPWLEHFRTRIPDDDNFVRLGVPTNPCSFCFAIFFAGSTRGLLA